MPINLLTGDRGLRRQRDKAKNYATERYGGAAEALQPIANLSQRQATEGIGENVRSAIRNRSISQYTAPTDMGVFGGSGARAVAGNQAQAQASREGMARTESEIAFEDEQARMQGRSDYARTRSEQMNQRAMERAAIEEADMNYQAERSRRRGELLGTAISAGFAFGGGKLKDLFSRRESETEIPDFSNLNLQGTEEALESGVSDAIGNTLTEAGQDLLPLEGLSDEELGLDDRAFINGNFSDEFMENQNIRRNTTIQGRFEQIPGNVSDLISNRYRDAMFHPDDLATNFNGNLSQTTGFNNPPENPSLGQFFRDMGGEDNLRSIYDDVGYLSPDFENYEEFSNFYSEQPEKLVDLLRNYDSLGELRNRRRAREEGGWAYSEGQSVANTINKGIVGVRAGSTALGVTGRKIGEGFDNTYNFFEDLVGDFSRGYRGE